MRIIGRIKEQDVLNSALHSGKAEFYVVYGRRRVGKTYLIKEYFNQKFSFYATGIANEKTRFQLRAFNLALKQYGCKEQTIPKDWFEAFERLKTILDDPMVYRDPISKKRVVFLDELPWMDTARSDFKSALEFFWNSYGSSQGDLLLIVCGSATSWIISNILLAKGGFYNRITGQIHLYPFSLNECEELLRFNGHSMTRKQVVECYMVFGGIPYYLNCLDKRRSLAQNIDEVCFTEQGQLHYEYENLFRSLFKNCEKHVAIIKTMAKVKAGILRTELAKVKEIGDGETLTKALLELEQCGFIRKYKNYTKDKSGFYYQIIDPFISFALNFLQEPRFSSWLTFINTPAYYNWCGNAFETICLNHLDSIKRALGISGVETMSYSWRSKEQRPGAQIDLLIDRKDEVINICEMKFTNEPFEIDSKYEKNLQNKIYAFRNETLSKKALHLTLISASGLKNNEYTNVVQNVLTTDDLFLS